MGIVQQFKAGVATILGGMGNVIQAAGQNGSAFQSVGFDIQAWANFALRYRRELLMGGRFAGGASGV